MADDADYDEGLLPSFNQTTPEVVASAILWGALHPHAGNHVLRSQEELAKLWISHGGDAAEAPQVDFSRHILICVFVDEGEYNEGPTIERIEERGGELTVFIGRFQRPWKMSNPSAVLQIRRFDGPCRFVESPEAACRDGHTVQPHWNNHIRCRKCGREYVNQLRSFVVGPLYEYSRRTGQPLHQIICFTCHICDSSCALPRRVAWSKWESWLRKSRSSIAADPEMQRLVQLVQRDESGHASCAGVETLPCPVCGTKLGQQQVLQRHCRHCGNTPVEIFKSYAV